MIDSSVVVECPNDKQPEGAARECGATLTPPKLIHVYGLVEDCARPRRRRHGHDHVDCAYARQPDQVASSRNE